MLNFSVLRCVPAVQEGESVAVFFKVVLVTYMQASSILTANLA